MRLRAAQRLETYWQEWPPAHESSARLAAHAGVWQPKATPAAPTKPLSEADELAQARATASAAALAFGGVAGIAFERRPTTNTGG